MKLKVILLRTKLFICYNMTQISSDNTGNKISRSMGIELTEQLMDRMCSSKIFNYL